MANTISVNDLPEVMEVRHIQQYLGISKNQAYDLANSGQFHVVRVGKLIKIPRESFLNWFKGQNGDEQE
jgi:excisionase family DNA binding protein